MNFLCIYLGEKGGGVALMHVYVWEHIVSLYYSTAWRMFTKLGRDEVLMVLTSVVVFQPDPPGADPGRGQNRSHGVPFFNNFFLQTGRLQQQTEFIAMI